MNAEFVFQTGDKYEPYIPATIDHSVGWVGASRYVQEDVINTTSLHGFTSLYSPNFAKGTH